MSEQCWYSEGLAFECTQCGDCCTGAPGVVWVTDEEIREIARVRGESYGEILIHHTRLVGGRRSLKEYANGDCTFFDGARRCCTVYSARPVQCRTWPFWPRHLESREAWMQVQKACKGVGRGSLVPLTVIRKQADQIDP